MGHWFLKFGLLKFALFACLLVLARVSPAITEEKMVLVRDITTIAGVRDNPLVGYSLVVGLNGTGDRQPDSVHYPDAGQHHAAHGRADSRQSRSASTMLRPCSSPHLFLRLPGRACSSTLRFPPSATPRASKVECCSWPLCTGRMARSMPKPRDHSRWVAIRRADPAIVNRSIIRPSAAYRTAERWSAIPQST